MKDHDNLGPENNESFFSTALWTGGALAVVAGIAVYASM